MQRWQSARMRRFTSMHPEPAEKQFYLKDFRHRAILFHVEDARQFERHASDMLLELKENPTLVILVARRFPRKRRLRPLRLARRDFEKSPTTLVPLSERLMDDCRVDVYLPRGLAGARALAYSRQLAVRLGVSKVVIVDERGGLDAGSGTRSFVHAAALARVVRAEEDCGDWGLSELQQLLAAVRSGIEAVNLTTAEGVEAELFTYQGTGTLVTAEEYCTVDRLGVEHFQEAERLLARGEREGFLLPRSEEQKHRLLLAGYGAWFGGTRLAGVCGLETEAYSRRRIGEVVGLYTITRFQGEGVGDRMLDHLIDVAKEAGLRALFACTSNQRAASFFERCGFERVSADKVPSVKWVGRRADALPMVLWLEL
ncbi:MAG TPA: GNAT family N-acetyltransferase [Candidatus Limnocylindrales bacterium]|nr:GNAT family N-acetyltransferase [Candidatus Limnocylindrales bacterium]